jgi:glycosyltransferase involved in cell wall biosynthesis
MPREQWLQRVARARCFVNASRLEEYGIAPLEALALGTPLVTMPSAGPYEALPIARRLAPACVAEEVSAPALAAALRAGLALQDPGYAARAAQELVPYRRSTMHRTVRHDVLPALGL